jgi:hypothetical protein
MACEQRAGGALEVGQGAAMRHLTMRLCPVATRQAQSGCAGSDSNRLAVLSLTSADRLTGASRRPPLLMADLQPPSHRQQGDLSLIRAIERGRPSEATEPNGQIGGSRPCRFCNAPPARCALAGDSAVDLLLAPQGLPTAGRGIFVENPVVSTESVFDL